jgi:Zn-dependent protease with chaperone function
MAACLQMLLKKYGSGGGKFFDSHPSMQERINKLNDPSPSEVAKRVRP